MQRDTASPSTIAARPRRTSASPGSRSRSRRCRPRRAGVPVGGAGGSRARGAADAPRLAAARSRAGPVEDGASEDGAREDGARETAPGAGAYASVTADATWRGIGPFVYWPLIVLIVLGEIPLNASPSGSSTSPTS